MGLCSGPIEMSQGLEMTYQLPTFALREDLVWVLQLYTFCPLWAVWMLHGHANGFCGKV